MVVRWAWIDAQLSKNEAAKPPPWRANGNGVEVGRFPHDGVHTRTFYAQISGVSEGRTPTVSKGGHLSGEGGRKVPGHCLERLAEDTYCRILQSHHWSSQSHRGRREGRVSE
jgi:hypothetical protein